MKRLESCMLVDTPEADPKRRAHRGSRRFAMVLLILLGASALGCFTLAYKGPPSDTPTAVIQTRGHALDYVRFDVFHANEGCPGASQLLWNSEYLGSIEMQRPNQSFEIPGNGYVRLVYRASTITDKSVLGTYAVNFGGEFVIKPSPGAEYIIESRDSRDSHTGRLHSRSIRIYPEVGDLIRVTCDEGVPVTLTPVENGTDGSSPTT